HGARAAPDTATAGEGAAAMAWVTWRQHRPQLLGGLALLVALAAAALGTDLPIRAAYHRDALSGCLPPSARSGCDIIVKHFQGEFDSWAAAVRGLAVLPALAGLFVGAPLLARELEHGTHAFAWTQSITRGRWLRPRFLSPLHRTVVASDTGRSVGDWVLSDTLVDGGGRKISTAHEDLAVLHAQQAGIDPHTYLVTLGWKRVISYQPAGRFWTFQ